MSELEDVKEEDESMDSEMSNEDVSYFTLPEFRLKKLRDASMVCRNRKDVLLEAVKRLESDDYVSEKFDRELIDCKVACRKYSDYGDVIDDSVEYYEEEIVEHQKLVARVRERYRSLLLVNPENDKMQKLWELNNQLIGSELFLRLCKASSALLFILLFGATCYALWFTTKNALLVCIVAAVLELILLSLYKSLASFGNKIYVQVTHLLEWRKKELESFFGADKAYDDTWEKQLLERVRKIESLSHPLFFESQTGITAYFILTLVFALLPLLVFRLQPVV